MDNQILDLETLLRVPYVDSSGGFDISPDGNQIAFSWNITGQWEIYTMPMDGSMAPGLITGGPGGKTHPRWAPEGQQLAYALDLDGGELFDIFTHDIATGQDTNLTPNTPDAIQPSFSWSPDGSQIVFISDRSGRFKTYILTIANGSVRLVHDQQSPEQVSWSPDGRWLAIVAAAVGQDYWTFLIPLAENEGGPISTDGQPISAYDSAWHPDSSKVVFCSNHQKQFRIGIYTLSTGEIKWITETVKKGKEHPQWSPDGQSLTYISDYEGVSEIVLLSIDTGGITTYQVNSGVHHTPHFTTGGKQLVFTFENPGCPCDLWRFSLENGSFQQMTYSLPADLEPGHFAMPTTVRYPSLDGQSVPALLYRPNQTINKSSAVIYIHGGPTWLTQINWDPLVQHMVSQGWVVLAPNYRGSTGYGLEWQLANRFDLGNGDTKDVVAGADFLSKEGLADPNRIGITGRSWGGYLTMTSMTQYPDRWAVGSAIVPFLNWFSGHANSREDLQRWDLENMGDPEKDYDRYRQYSPFFYLDRITAPVQMVCGAHDIRCPASESIEARDVLVAQGKTCELVVYEDEGHSFLKIENVVDAIQKQMKFLSKVLK